MKLIQTSSFCMSSLNENIDLDVSCDVDPKLTIDEHVPLEERWFGRPTKKNLLIHVFTYMFQTNLPFM